LFEKTHEENARFSLEIQRKVKKQQQQQQRLKNVTKHTLSISDSLEGGHLSDASLSRLHDE
jgi:hypothetical protein